MRTSPFLGVTSSPASSTFPSQQCQFAAAHREGWILLYTPASFTPSPPGFLSWVGGFIPQPWVEMPLMDLICALCWKGKWAPLHSTLRGDPASLQPPAPLQLWAWGRNLWTWKAATWGCSCCSNTIRVTQQQMKEWWWHGPPLSSKNCIIAPRNCRPTLQINTILDQSSQTLYPCKLKQFVLLNKFINLPCKFRHLKGTPWTNPRLESKNEWKGLE